jgi:hypothetical protein
MNAAKRIMETQRAQDARAAKAQAASVGGTAAPPSPSASSANAASDSALGPAAAGNSLTSALQSAKSAVMQTLKQLTDKASVGAGASAERSSPDAERQAKIAASWEKVHQEGGKKWEAYNAAVQDRQMHTLPGEPD